jgi:hypothetical protein
MWSEFLIHLKKPILANNKRIGRLTVMGKDMKTAMARIRMESTKNTRMNQARGDRRKEKMGKRKDSE